MPLSLSDFAADEATVTVAGSLNVTYKPSRRTAKRAHITAAEMEAGDESALYRNLVDFVVDWDLTGPLEGWVPETDASGAQLFDEDGRALGEFKVVVKDGEPVPLTVEALENIPAALILEIMAAIQEDVSPKSRTNSSSKSRKR